MTESVEPLTGDVSVKFGVDEPGFSAGTFDVPFLVEWVRLLLRLKIGHILMHSRNGRADSSLTPAQIAAGRRRRHFELHTDITSCQI